MTLLVVLACLNSAPSVCDEHSVAFLPEVSVITCMTSSMPQIALWAERHPHLKVARWTCQASETRRVKA